MSRLVDALRGVTDLGVDTSPVIYFIEANPRYDQLVAEVFGRIADGRLRGVSSVITLTEVLVHPLRHGATELAQRYRQLLLGSANFDTRQITSDIAERSADLRARYDLRVLTLDKLTL